MCCAPTQWPWRIDVPSHRNGHSACKQRIMEIAWAILIRFSIIINMHRLTSLTFSQRKMQTLLRHTHTHNRSHAIPIDERWEYNFFPKLFFRVEYAKWLLLSPNYFSGCNKISVFLAHKKCLSFVFIFKYSKLVWCETHWMWIWWLLNGGSINESLDNREKLSINSRFRCEDRRKLHSKHVNQLPRPLALNSSALEYTTDTRCLHRYPLGTT